MRFGVAQSAVDERLEVHVADLADTAATSTKVIHLWSVAVSGSTEDVAIDGLGVGGVCVTEPTRQPLQSPGQYDVCEMPGVQNKGPVIWVGERIGTKDSPR